MECKGIFKQHPVLLHIQLLSALSAYKPMDVSNLFLLDFVLFSILGQNNDI